MNRAAHQFACLLCYCATLILSRALHRPPCAAPAAHGPSSGPSSGSASGAMSTLSILLNTSSPNSSSGRSVSGGSSPLPQPPSSAQITVAAHEKYTAPGRGAGAVPGHAGAAIGCGVPEVKRRKTLGCGALGDLFPLVAERELPRQMTTVDGMSRLEPEHLAPRPPKQVRVATLPSVVVPAVAAGAAMGVADIANSAWLFGAQQHQACVGVALHPTPMLPFAGAQEWQPQTQQQMQPAGAATTISDVAAALWKLGNQPDLFGEPLTLASLSPAVPTFPRSRVCARTLRLALRSDRQ